MHPPSVVRRGLFRSAAALLTSAVAACGAPAPTPEPTTTSSSPQVTDVRVALAAHAAQAEDRRYSALYTLDSPGRAPRQVVATSAVDGSWRVDIPEGALGGTVDVSIVQIDAGIFVCSLPSASRPTASTCIRVADPGERLPKKYDPAIQRVFHDWLQVLTDRESALSVTAAQPIAGVTGTCYAVESISASLKAPLDVGIYCFADDGLLTGARFDFGELRLASEADAAPPSVDLPGPVVAGAAVGQASPQAATTPETPESETPVPGDSGSETPGSGTATAAPATPKTSVDTVEPAAAPG